MTHRILILAVAGMFIFACDAHPTSPGSDRASGQSALLTRATANAATTDAKIVSFETMYGVDEGFVKHNPIRGVRGDELPWVVGSAMGSLTVSGHLTASVRGIVFANDS